MAEGDSRSDSTRKAARKRGACSQCGNQSLIERDGSEIGGLPGIAYRYCNNCGWSQAKTKKQKFGL
jgi:anaerobic ribonucleoside-triphosphate reductase